MIDTTNQLDLLSALYHHEAEELEAALRWNTFVSNARYTKTLILLCRETRENTRILWEIDDLIQSAAVINHNLMEIEVPLIEYVNKRLQIYILSYSPKNLDDIIGNVERMTVPKLPHIEPGIISARSKVVICKNKLINLLNDI